MAAAADAGVEVRGSRTLCHGENSTRFRVPLPEEGGKDAGESSGVLIFGLKGKGIEVRCRWLDVGGLGRSRSGTDMLSVSSILKLTREHV